MNSKYEEVEYIDFLLVYFSECMIIQFVYNGLSNYMYYIAPPLGQNNALLLGMIICSVPLVFYNVFFKDRNPWTAFCAGIFVYGIYTIIQYGNVLGPRLRQVLLCAAILSLGYCITILIRRVKSKNRAKVFRNRVYRCIWGTTTIVTLAFVGLMVPYSVKGFMNSPKASMAEETEAKALLPEGKLIDLSMDELILFEDSRWKSLSKEEKLALIKMVVNIERSHLRIYPEINVVEQDMGKNTLGRYTDGEHIISISSRLLESGSGYTVLDTVCHECHHAYRDCLLAVYEKLGENERMLPLFEDVRIYYAEENNYMEGTDDFDKYYKQLTESDARAYAADRVIHYMKLIEDYLKEHKGEDLDEY